MSTVTVKGSTAKVGFLGKFVTRDTNVSDYSTRAEVRTGEVATDRELMKTRYCW